MLTYVDSLDLDPINRYGAGHLLQRGGQGLAVGSQQVEATQGAAQPVQALVHTLQRCPAVNQNGLHWKNGHQLGCCMYMQPHRTQHISIDQLADVTDVTTSRCVMKTTGMQRMWA